MVTMNEMNHVKTSKFVLNRNAIKFKENIEMELAKSQSLISPQENPTGRKSLLGRSKYAGPKAGSRYECIYKNLLRDIRQFYSARYQDFLSTIDNPFKKNPQYKYILFPYFTLHFTLLHFDTPLLEAAIEQSEFGRVEFIKRLAFMFGCFILPKYMMKSYSQSVPQRDSNNPSEELP